MSQPAPPFRVHTCHWCSAQEIDPLASDRLTEQITIQFRGSSVYDGASRGCEFFQALFTKLIKTLDLDFHDPFLRDSLIYDLTVSVPRNHDSNWASGGWRTTADRVPLSHTRYGILALPGKKRLC